MGLTRPVSFLGRALLDVTIVTALLIFIPGIPPHVKFESFSITPAKELEGPLAVNEKLSGAKAILDGKITGPESIAIRGNELYTGLIGGNVVRIVNGDLKVIARFGKHCEGKWEERKCGRPLGMRFDGNGKLVVTDAYYGLFRVDVDTGSTETLVSANDTIDGHVPKNPNDLDISKDGTIYWTDSSITVNLQDALIEFLGEPTGRVIKYDSETKKSTVLLKGLHFANGIQLSKNEDYLMIAESPRNRVLRYYLKGLKAGQNDVLLDGLPGAPDNIRPNGKGGFFVSLIVPRFANVPSPLDVLGPLPLIRKFLLRLVTLIKVPFALVNAVFPNEYSAKALYYIGHLEPLAVLTPKHSIIIELDEEGTIIGSLQSTKGEVAHISQITVDDGGQFAYLGSPYNTQIWKVSVGDLSSEKKVPEIKLVPDAPILVEEVKKKEL